MFVSKNKVKLNKIKQKIINVLFYFTIISNWQFCQDIRSDSTYLLISGENFSQHEANLVQ